MFVAKLSDADPETRLCEFSLSDMVGVLSETQWQTNLITVSIVLVSMVSYIKAHVLKVVVPFLLIKFLESHLLHMSETNTETMTSINNSIVKQDIIAILTFKRLKAARIRLEESFADNTPPFNEADLFTRHETVKIWDAVPSTDDEPAPNAQHKKTRRGSGKGRINL